MRAISTGHLALLLALCAGLLGCAACGNDRGASSAPADSPAPAAASAPVMAVPDEEAAAARAALGSDAQVLLFGEVGGEGTQQVVVIDSLPGSRGTAAAYVGRKGSKQTVVDVNRAKVSRVSILNKENGSWSEVLRADEYLKNRNGYLRGGPASAVAGWSLDASVENGKQVLRFTPLAPEAAVKNGPVSVTWNPKTKLYQSLDPSGKKFLGENAALETRKSQLR